MAPRAWLPYAALLAAACACGALAARPFAVNNTALRHTHPLRGRPGAPPAAGQGRRRARDAGPPPAPAPAGPYWGNASLLGLEVECADAAWKACLRVGRLLHEPSGGCFELGAARPCEAEGGGGGVLMLDAEALRGGRLRARCRSVACPSPLERRMAWDGACREVPDVLGRLCGGRAAGLAPHPLGGWECAGPGGAARAVTQPDAPGRCALPELRPRAPEALRVRCSAAQAECLAQGRLPFAGGCHAPLSTHACPPGHRLVLRERAARAGRLRVECERAQPCGPRARRLRADGLCHAQREISRRLCPRDALSETPAGDWVCAAEPLTFYVEGGGAGGAGGECQVTLVGVAVPSPPNVVRPAGPECAADDAAVCAPTAQGEAPRVVIASEDD